MRFRVCSVFVLICAAAFGSDSVGAAADKLEQASGFLQGSMRIEFRLLAAKSLAARHPDLSERFVQLAVGEISSSNDLNLRYGALSALATVAPGQITPLLPHLAPAAIPGLTGELARTGHVGEAVGLYRQALATGDLQSGAANLILTKLMASKPAEAKKLFADMLAAANFATLDPYEAYRFLNCAKTIAPADAPLATSAYQRVKEAASASGYGAKAPNVLTAVFQTSKGAVETKTSRETVLAACDILLRDGALRVKSMSMGQSGEPKQNQSSRAAISAKMGRMRGLATDGDRARLVLEIVRDIQAIPEASIRMQLAENLSNLATEGDLGKPALSAVAGVLAQALQDAPAPDSSPYLQLASLVRFEQLPAPKPTAPLAAADALLDLERWLHQEAGFELTALDGKKYSLAALRGQVVLLNFWATWCPPCRREMPDMEKLYAKLRARGLVVLAVSDEERETVAVFQDKQKYSFPILLDPDRTVNRAFDIDGIPKSFLFDRQGRLVAQAMDMRTEAQFLEMLKQAGI